MTLSHMPHPDTPPQSSYEDVRRRPRLHSHRAPLTLLSKPLVLPRHSNMQVFGVGPEGPQLRFERNVGESIRSLECGMVNTAVRRTHTRNTCSRAYTCIRTYRIKVRSYIPGPSRAHKHKHTHTHTHPHARTHTHTGLPGSAAVVLQRAHRELHHRAAAREGQVGVVGTKGWSDEAGLGWSMSLLE
jgi:hypothetical protein